MAKPIQITKDELQKIIKEGVENIHKKTLIENRIRQINEELYNLSESANKEFICWNAGSGIYEIAPYNQGVSWHDDEDVFKGSRKECEQYKEKMEHSYFEKNNFDDNYWNQKNLKENNDVANTEIMKILDGYLEAALWTEEDEIGNANIDSDVSNDAKIDAYKDIKKFLNQAGNLIDGIDQEQIGHDFWLSRNGHGAGFFDRGLGEVGDKLSDIARSMGEKSLFWGEDEKIHIE